MKNQREAVPTLLTFLTKKSPKLVPLYLEAVRLKREQAELDP